MISFIPKTMDELIRDLSQMTAQGKIVSGGTDLTIELNSRKISPEMLLYLGDIEELHTISKESGLLRIGACATMHEIVTSGVLGREYGAVLDAAESIGSRQVRNRATIGGNIAGASPGADMLPVLFLHRAEIEIASPGGIRRSPISDVVLDSGRTSLQYNEAISAIFLPPPPDKNYTSIFIKLGYRQKVSIARISLAVGLAFDKNGAISTADIVAGAIAPLPIHVSKAENILIGTTITQETKRKAGEALSELISELTPEKEYKAGAAVGIAEDALGAAMQNAECRIRN